MLPKFQKAKQQLVQVQVPYAMVMLTVPPMVRNVPFSNKRINMLKQPVSAFLKIYAVQWVDLEVYHSTLIAMVMLLMLPNQVKLTQTLTWLQLKN